MKFGPIPIETAEGRILGHNIAGPDGRRALRKGNPLSAKDIERLRQLGREMVYVALLEPGDVVENEAALRIAHAAQGSGVSVSKPTTGRANLHAEILGLLRIDVDRLTQLNMCEAVTLATMPSNAVVQPGQMVATLKIIAYAIPDNIVREAEFIGSQQPVNSGRGKQPLIFIEPILPQSIGMILSGTPSAADRIRTSFVKAMSPRIESWGSSLDRVDFVPLEDESGETHLADVLLEHINQGIDIIILAGETAIMDRYDIAPRAVERSGGRITAFGAPVDPGNLLLLARHDATGRPVHIVGAPGCARSPKQNIVDLIIPRLLAGDYLTKMDIVKFGLGGMLEDVAERGRPRKYN